MPIKFEINDKVQLVTGGAEMILKQFENEEQQKATCFWISDEGQYFEKAFDLKILKNREGSKQLESLLEERYGK